MQTIGGHFSALIGTGASHLPIGYGFESARAALASVLHACNDIKRIHVPNYICSAVLEAIHSSGIEAISYGLDDQFRLGHIALSDFDLVLLVNFFGICSPVVESAISDLPRDKIIIDCSQSYFDRPPETLAAVYSLRKFLPVSDGGLAVTRLCLEQDAADEDRSVARFEYLIRRVGQEPEGTRQLYLRAESEFSDVSRRKMSDFTRRISQVIDHVSIANQRKANYEQLAAKFGLPFGLPLGSQVPLCFPLRVRDGARMRSLLLKNRILVPHYWSNVVPLTDFEFSLCNNTVFLPIDHRYQELDMVRIIDVCCDSGLLS